MEMGNNESSKNIYQKLVELSPNEGFSKYMCLAQLSVEMEAVNFYKKGIELMLIEYEKQEQGSASRPSTSASASNFDDDEDDEDFKNITKLDISTAYGSIAEIYLTDLCMEENAEELCKSFLDKSLEYDSKNPESLQLLASYWLSKENIDEARKAILESLDNWLPKYIEANESGPLVDPTQAISLTYDSRINTTRILTEVQEFDKAITVLEQLIEEDDEVVVVWYMLGWVNYCKGEDYFSNAKFYLKKAKEMAIKIKYDQKYLDEDLKNHINELLENLANVQSDDEDNENDEDDKENLDDDDDNFETDSDEEDEEADNCINSKNLNNSNGYSKSKNKSIDKNNNNVDESMETT